MDSQQLNRRSRRLVSALVAASAMLVGGCSQLKDLTKQDNALNEAVGGHSEHESDHRSESSSQRASAETNGGSAKKKAPRNDAGKTFAFTDKSPNPYTPGGVSEEPKLNPGKDLGLKGCGPDADVTRPIKVKLPAGNYAFRVDGNINRLLIASEQNHVCVKGKSTSLNHMPAGIYKIYAGVDHQYDRAIDWSLTVEDLKRPVAIPFDLSQAQKFGKVDGLAIRVGKFGSGGSQKHWLNGGYYWFGKDPVATFTLDKPAKGLHVYEAAMAQGGTGVEVIGPLTDNWRDAKIDAYLSRWSKQKHTVDLPAGKYAIRVGESAEDLRSLAGHSYSLVIQPSDAKIEPLTHARPPEGDLPLDQRMLGLWYPALATKALQYNDALRMKLLETAPKSLFVYTLAGAKNFNVYGLGVESSNDRKRDDGKRQPLVANEPVLVLDHGSMVLATDGTMYRASELDKNLTSAPPASLAFPKAPRNTVRGKTSLIKQATGSTKKLYEHYNKSWQSNRACKMHYRQVADEARRHTHSSARIAKIDRAEMRNIKHHCHTKKALALRKKFLEKATDQLIEVRKKGLEKVKRRFQQ